MLNPNPILVSQEKDYYFNRTQNTWGWHNAEAKKRGTLLASVASEEEHRMLHQITGGTGTWLGACRKSTSEQPPDRRDFKYHGANDWEWTDGTPWTFKNWNVLEPDNGSTNVSGGEDRVCMSKGTWLP